MGKQGIIALSFGEGRSESGQPIGSNKALGAIFSEVLSNTNAVVAVLQWEIGECVKCVKQTRYSDILIVKEHREKGKYLDSDDVIEQATPFFKKAGVTEVWLICHTFLHRFKCRKVLKKKGFKVLIPKTKIKVPFAKEAKQWWVHSWTGLFLYAVLQGLFGRKGR